MTAMNGLRHARAWYVLGALLTLLVVIGSLVPARDLPRLFLSDKLQHLLAYLALALWFGGLMAPRRYLPLALGLLALGAGIEIVQGLMGLGREADWRDFLADALGIGLGLSLCMAGLRHWATWLEQWPRTR
jgi:VanZ family protein